MTLIYTFTPDEQRFILERHNRYLEGLQFLIDLHQLKGSLAPSNDGKGIIDLNQAPVQPEPSN